MTQNLGDYDSKLLHGLIAKALDKDWDDLTLKDRVHVKLVRMMNALLNEREISLHENIAYAIGLSLKEKSFNFMEVFINESKPVVALKKKSIPQMEIWNPFQLPG